MGNETSSVVNNDSNPGEAPEIWNLNTEKQLIEVWKENYERLRASAEKPPIFVDIAAKMSLLSVNCDSNDVETKIQNFVEKYNSENKGPGNCNSVWPHFKAISEFINDDEVACKVPQADKDLNDDQNVKDIDTNVVTKPAEGDDSPNKRSNKRKLSDIYIDFGKQIDLMCAASEKRYEANLELIKHLQQLEVQKEKYSEQCVAVQNKIARIFESNNNNNF